ncbi:MAG: hypothetical protein M1820_006067 [Bogoriella megaspora]|nr:MAG: hypothetical protein M1820_006067 [Bogoriella megaspora]
MLSALFQVLLLCTPFLISLPLSSAETCTIDYSGDASIDDAPAVLDAFDRCGNGGVIVFQNSTYHINSVMNTTGLQDVVVQLQGTLLWSDDIDYWLDNSMPIGYQNQSTVWFFGGDNVTFEGYGCGTFDGNGQAWYNFVNGQSNYPNRPHAFTPWYLTNSEVTGLRFVQSQMWTMSILHSDSVLFQNIYVNSTSSNRTPARNTDGADTIFSSNIHFDQWTVANGDDSISMKANSTDITITNCTFYRGLGIAIGSIGQYKDVYETIENIYAENIQYYDTRHAAYFKTWTGDQVGYPPNGGGGGLGGTYTLPMQGLWGETQLMIHIIRLEYDFHEPAWLIHGRICFYQSMYNILWHSGELLRLEIPDSRYYVV